LIQLLKKNVSGAFGTVQFLDVWVEGIEREIEMRETVELHE